MTIPLCYVAGSYSAPTPHEREINIQNAWRLGIRVAELGAYPVVPHMCSAHLDAVQPADFWIAATLEQMRRCDAVIFTADWQRSTGARGERAEAERLGLPCFDTIDDLAAWLLPPERRTGT